MNDRRPDLGVLLRGYRIAAHMTQEDLANRAGMNSRTVRDIERGAIRAPRRSSVESLATALSLAEVERSGFLAVAEAARWPPAGPVGADPDEMSTVVPRQLPPDITYFTGRTRELAALQAWWEAGGEQRRRAGAITIVGTAGVGKTAVAVHWSHRIAGEFPDGQLCANLHGYDVSRASRSARVLSGFLRALGVQANRIPADQDEAAGLYRSLLADKRMLILLDNARLPDQIRPLLPASEGCLAVITSRHAMGGLLARDGVQPLVVDVLPDDDAAALLTAMIDPRQVASDPSAVAELARLCSFLPLSLRVAAASLGTREHQLIGDYVKVLAHGETIAGLTVDDTEPNPVRAAFDQSYSALLPDEQRVFRLAAHVPGPDLTADAVAALAGQSPAEAERLLCGLSSANVVNEHALGRYSFHDLVRSYARTRARETGDDVAVALNRLFAWYLGKAVAARVQSKPETVSQGVSAQAWMRTERANLLAAAHHATEHGQADLGRLLLEAMHGRV